MRSSIAPNTLHTTAAQYWQWSLTINQVILRINMLPSYYSYCRSFSNKCLNDLVPVYLSDYFVNSRRLKKYRDKETISFIMLLIIKPFQKNLCILVHRVLVLNPFFSVKFLRNFTTIVMSGENSHLSVSQSVSHSVSHRVNFPGGVYDVCS
jgi:hypothetical protein